MNAPLPGFGTSGVTSTESRIEHFGGAIGSSALTVCVASSVRTAPAAMATTLALRCPQILSAWRDAGYRTKVQSGPRSMCTQGSGRVTVAAELEFNSAVPGSRAQALPESTSPIRARWSHIPASGSRAVGRSLGEGVVQCSVSRRFAR